MSGIRSTTLSSLVTGAVLAAVLRSDGKCGYGYASVQLSVLWLGHLYVSCLPSLYSVQPQLYVDSNSDFMCSSAASAVPRLYVSKDPTVVHMVMLTLLLGVSDALAATMPPNAADASLLALCAVIISAGLARRLSIIAFVYSVLTHPYPGAQSMVRVLSLALSIACSNMHLPKLYVIGRCAVAILVAVLYTYGPCTAWLRAVPPVAVLHLGLTTFRARPVVVLIIASVFT